MNGLIKHQGPKALKTWRFISSISSSSRVDWLQKPTPSTALDQPAQRAPKRYFGTEKRKSPDATGNDDESKLRPDVAFMLKHYKIHRREKEGTDGWSREYLLLPPDAYVPQVIQDPSLPAAALFAHRNVVFGARSFHGYDATDVCVPLVIAAIEESEALEPGRQIQAVANLKGLSDWVALCFENKCEGSEVLMRLAQAKAGNDADSKDSISLEAIRAIATGIPRPGHSVVGQGTFRDGQEAWEELAEEYITLGLSKEANLYKKLGGKLVGIEHLADTSATNMKSAGGAIARLFFL